MKTLVVALLLGTLGFSAFADQNICRDRLLKLVNLDPAATKIDARKLLVGTVNDSNLNDPKNRFDRGAPCTLELTIYQVGTPTASVSVSDSYSFLEVFNHWVNADNLTADCKTDSPEAVSGTYNYRKNSGWHNYYSTGIHLMREHDGSFRLQYLSSETGGSTKRLTCTGQLVDPPANTK